MKIIEQEMEKCVSSDRTVFFISSGPSFLFSLDLTEQVIKKENIECDWHRFTTLDIAMDQRCKKEMDVLLKEYIDDGGHNASIIKYCDDPLAIQKVPLLTSNCLTSPSDCNMGQVTRAIGGLASTEVPCASLWPYKLVCG